MNPEVTLEELKQLRRGNPPLEGAGLFGATIPTELAQLVIVPVPFEATTSYGGGTSQAPQAMVPASHQLDLFDRCFKNPFLAGIALDEEIDAIAIANGEAKPLAQKVIASWERLGKPDMAALQRVNQMSGDVNRLVEQRCEQLLSQGKLVGLLGGDHSCPYGLLRALANHHDGFGILHIDAHHDLRAAYEGFEHSHASIMYNALETIPQVTRLVSLGIRDFSEEEHHYAERRSEVSTLYDLDLARRLSSGEAFLSVIREYIQQLPSKIYVSFDIDGLDPQCCPNTGTPVAGGFSFNQALLILELLYDEGKQMIGFDLCEVAPGDDEWDANVGARILYKLCGLSLASNKKQSLLEG